MKSRFITSGADRPLWHLSLGCYLAFGLVVLWEGLAAAIGSGHSLVEGAEGVVGSLCHHLPGRTLLLNRRPLPICARCTGIWLGWLVALPVWWAAPAAHREPKRARRKIQLLAGAGSVAAGLAIAEAGGWVATASSTRFWLGLPLGLMAGSLVLEGWPRKSEEVACE